MGVAEREGIRRQGKKVGEDNKGGRRRRREERR